MEYRLLCLDMGLNDCLYRLRRDDDGLSLVVYVRVQDIHIIADDKRTEDVSTGIAYLVLRADVGLWWGFRLNAKSTGGFVDHCRSVPTIVT